jgi:hypothetical protein
MSQPPREVQIVGGPNDGRIVEYVGRVMIEPVKKTVSYAAPDDDDLPCPDMPVRRYVLALWRDGTWRYVLEDIARGIGAR